MRTIIILKNLNIPSNFLKKYKNAHLQCAINGRGVSLHPPTHLSLTCISVLSPGLFFIYFQYIDLFAKLASTPSII